MTALRLHQPASITNIIPDATYMAPVPGDGEIRILVKALSLNFRDSLVINGFFPCKDGIIPLSDAAGEVIAIGANVRDFQIGDSVISVFHPKWHDGHMDKIDLDNSPGGPADGFACTTATRPATAFTKAPRNLDFLEAATLPCAAVTAWRAIITDAQIKPGDHVLIQGTGGVSLFALQFAKAAGATVIATTSSTEKMGALSALGADYIINYRETPNWAERVLEITQGRGVECIIEVGGPNTLSQSFACARTGAHIALIGAVAGFDIDTMPFAIVQAKRLRLQAVTVGSRADQMAMVRAIEANGIHPMIDSSFPLDELAAAFQHLQGGGHIGKIVITT